MIVVDLEFTGFDFNKYGVWQIGALEFYNPKNIFLEEARLEDGDEAIKDAIKIVGKTEEELRDKNKQSQKQLLERFFEWCKKTNAQNIICHNTQWDFGFLLTKAHKYGLEPPFRHRVFDLHSIAQIKYFEVKGEFLMKDGHSDMASGKVFEFCGLPEERMAIRDGKVKEGKPHNALEDCKFEAECFSRLVYGKNLLPEFKKFKIPEYLKQDR